MLLKLTLYITGLKRHRSTQFHLNQVYEFAYIPRRVLDYIMYLIFAITCGLQSKICLLVCFQKPRGSTWIIYKKA